MFEPSSRYHGVPTTTHTLADGRTVTHLRRRFLPRPEELTAVGEHVVTAGERLDGVAARRYGDPEQSWRIADANRTMRPDELTAVPGRRLRITLPAEASAAAVGGERAW
ncbi:LysM peptidoglycan-binding domain-containing protein [Streptomyces sp. MZ04]|uniref:LysM peptidoglycan-binding domain-containing protein n=1 Tax=Streptomyces sp. MZ04 TaxID=2559236 RepID=UPI00107E7960|nr:LysM peptidoglycan-binding domain-containing protein [Streptomyces sp. MZ04]TGA86305.1 LysM domain-containing protein [Streptomyces sp. MZ04]